MATIKRYILPSAILFFVVFIALLWLAWVSRGPERMKLASSQESNLDRNRFYVIGFPINDKVNVRRIVDGEPVGKLDRAILLTADELDGPGNSISVFMGNQQQCVLASEVTLFPPENVEKLMESLNEEIARWGVQSDWRSVALSVSNVDIEANTKDLTVRLTDKRGRKVVFTYRSLGHGLQAELMQSRRE